MNVGKTLFAQIMEFVLWTSFSRIVTRYGGDSGVRRLTCAEQFRVMAFAQLTWCESLRDIQVTLVANVSKLYAMGFRHAVDRSTLADANESRHWRIRADLAAVLIRRARKLYLHEEFGLELKNTVYALDSTTIDLCLAFFDRAPFRLTKAAVKMQPDACTRPRWTRLRASSAIRPLRSMGTPRPRITPQYLHRIKFKDSESGKTFVFLTNNTGLPALPIAALYKSRWQVELFFKLIKRFLGTSENAVKTKIWCAVAAYVLIAIVKKELQLKVSLYTLLHILSVSFFEKP